MDNKFTCRNGKVVTISIDEFSDYQVKVTGPLDEKIGGMEFREIDDAYTCLKLTWMYLDEAGAAWKRQGIGQECLRLVGEVSGFPIVAERHDGQRQDDGSHLTGDAPAFVGIMRERGYILT